MKLQKLSIIWMGRFLLGERYLWSLLQRQGKDQRRCAKELGLGSSCNSPSPTLMQNLFTWFLVFEILIVYLNFCRGPSSGYGDRRSSHYGIPFCFSLFSILLELFHKYKLLFMMSLTHFWYESFFMSKCEGYQRLSNLYSITVIATGRSRSRSRSPHYPSGSRSRYRSR